MNYYVMLKERLKVLHKLQPKHFQTVFEKLSVIKFQLVEIETSFSVSFVLRIDIEILSIEKIQKYKQTKIFSTLNLVVNQMTIYMI